MNWLQTLIILALGWFGLALLAFDHLMERAGAQQFTPIAEHERGPTKGEWRHKDE